MPITQPYTLHSFILTFMHTFIHHKHTSDVQHVTHRQTRGNNIGCKIAVANNVGWFTDIFLKESHTVKPFSLQKSNMMVMILYLLSDNNYKKKLSFCIASPPKYEWFKCIHNIECISRVLKTRVSSIYSASNSN